MPVFTIKTNIANGLLVVGAQMRLKTRREFYETRVPKHLRPLSFDEFNKKCALVRDDPLMMMTLLQHMDERYYGPFEKMFAAYVYDGLAVPKDVGRQALAFGCAQVVAIWLMMGWPRIRVIHRRLHALAAEGRRMHAEELEMIVYHRV